MTRKRERSPPRMRFKRKIVWGRESTVITERGTQATTRYALVEASHLIASHDNFMKPDPRYPPVLQPRDRERCASEDQVSRIAQGLKPELLCESPKASDGAPIIGTDYAVEGGNGRVIAIRRAFYKESSSPAKNPYSLYLAEHAREFGFLARHLWQFKQPVMVRVRVTDLDRILFAREANESSVAAMSASEQAKEDAAWLDSGLMSIFYPNDEGEIATSANREFVRGFIQRVIAPTERGRYADESGYLSSDGVRRIRNAVFAKAFGDTEGGMEAVARLAESVDDNVRRISTVLLHKAGRLAVLKHAIHEGARYPLDLSEDLAVAMRKLSVLREAEMTVQAYLDQGALFGDDLTALQRRILAIFDCFKLSTRTLSEILDLYLKSVEALGDPRQAALVGRVEFSREELFEDAIKRATEKKESLNLFTPEIVEVIHPEKGEKKRQKRLKRLKAKKPEANPLPAKKKPPKHGIKVVGEPEDPNFKRSEAAKRAWITIRKNRALEAAKRAKKTRAA